MAYDVYTKRIIYPNDEGGISILVPSPSCESIEQLLTSLPPGKPYQIIPVEDVPDDRTYRNAWIYEEN